MLGSILALLLSTSCDIAVAPAATLLLPYFEVGLDRDPATLFTVTNASNVTQVARVTLWTDRAYPVVSFNLYLTGYDVQSINLYDVIVRGRIDGGHFGIRSWDPPRGEHTSDNPLLDESECGQVPPLLPADVERMLTAFTSGRVPGCLVVGGEHENAIGYATIDVVGNCGTAMPIDPEYFTEDLRYDNVLLGDSQLLRGDASDGSPMVHIRAFPSHDEPVFERTFYGRFQTSEHPQADARQPLPSLFAARWVHDDDNLTSLKIWREGLAGANADCASYAYNAEIDLADSVVFDEDENGEGQYLNYIMVPVSVGVDPIVIPPSAMIEIDDSDVFGQDIVDDERSGWLYINLDDVELQNGAQQGWVVATTTTDGRAWSVDAAALENGCFPIKRVTQFSEDGIVGVLP